MPRWGTPWRARTERPLQGAERRSALLPGLPAPPARAAELVAWASCPCGMARMAMPRWGALPTDVG